MRIEETTPEPRERTFTLKLNEKELRYIRFALEVVARNPAGAAFSLANGLGGFSIRGPIDEALGE